ncbi:hypothetical protein PC9H_001382 [Pleurotus ostreatus]|uniref:DNA 3'-5' helicase n=1 Tax=Pleurotus ostreatus TaxID=5322 RepID=A0A8H7A3N8_PLEOS|nr:uncharacterized protein PC9H_001382 [Pleurotus ostreatus]KAF7441033.1 hypothetical protein PC9H_001382 [Pleurotus ostreatus]KAJ8699499.1 hypothetical protein PTI98_002609 [Pleurotus ostreatus]
MANHQELTPTGKPLPGSPQWFQQVIAPKLGYSMLKDWQVELACTMFRKEDVVCIAPTGSGKSALLHIPLMAAKTANSCVLGMSVAPTKSLCDDQARAATDRGLKAVAVYSDSLRAAAAKGKDLMEEIRKDEWDLFIIPPELLHSDEINKFLHAQTPGSQSEVAQLDLVFIDECHLVREHGDDFRQAYSRIGQIRGRLDFRIPWVAVTATLPPGKITNDVLQSLGFEEGDYKMHRMRVDVPNIQYIPRFFEHSISTSTFFDISWVIPVVAGFLQSLVPLDWDDRDKIIMPFYSLLSDDYRRVYISAYRKGTTQVLVGTDTLTCGMDVADIEQVIILGVPPTPERLSQQIGRAGHNGKPAHAYVYAPQRVRIKEDDELTGSQKEANEAVYRSKMNVALLHWFNPSSERCPRSVFCGYYGDEFIPVDNCCIYHCPGDYDVCKIEIERWVDAFQKLSDSSKATQRPEAPLPSTEPSKQSTAELPLKEAIIGLTNDLPTKPESKSHRVIDKTIMYPAARWIISAWAERTWLSAREDNTLLPHSAFLAKFLQDRLCSRMHTVTSVEKLQELLPEWGYLPTHGQQLVDVCDKILTVFDTLWKERECKGNLKMAAQCKPSRGRIQRNE